MTFKVAAQNHLVGMKVGANRSTVYSSNYPYPFKYLTGVNTGITYEFLLSKHFSLGADLLYNQLGYKTNFSFDEDDGGSEVVRKNEFNVNLDYISLPIKAGVILGDRYFAYSNIGIISSLLIKTQTGYPEFVFKTKRVPKFDIAGLAEIGFGCKIKNKYSLYTACAYQHGFTTISKNSYFSNNILKYRAFTVSIGLKYALTKE